MASIDSAGEGVVILMNERVLFQVLWQHEPFAALPALVVLLLAVDKLVAFQGKTGRELLPATLH